MTIYRIEGTVELIQKTQEIELEAKKTLSTLEDEWKEIGSLKIEAWDKDERLDDYLAKDKTRDDGSFAIEFSDLDFLQDIGERDWIPDVFFRVYQKKEFIGSTAIISAETIGEYRTLWLTQFDSIEGKFPKYPRQRIIDLSRLLIKLNNEDPDENPIYEIQITGIGSETEDTSRKFSQNGHFDYKDDKVVDILPTTDRVASTGYNRTSTSLGGDRTGGSLQEIVDNALNQVLCRNPKDNPKALIDSLTKSFTPEENNGRITYTWTPCSYGSTQTELGGSVSGAQASLYHRAKTLLEDGLKLLNKLYSLDPAGDPQNMEAVRSVVRTHIVELINEFGTQGGPREQRVENLFQILLGDLDTQSNGKFGGQIKELSDIFGLSRSRINSVEEEQNFSNFLIIKDSLLSIRDSWNNFIQDTGSGAYIGTQLVLLSQALSVVSVSVEETYRIMDSVFLGAAERQSILIDFTKAEDESLSPEENELNNPRKLNRRQIFIPENISKIAFNLPDGTSITEEEVKQLKPAMTLEKLLSWALSWSSKEAPTIAIAGGKLGIAKSIAETANKLMVLMQAASYVRLPNSSYQREGVRRAMRDLAYQLYEVKRLASELIPPLTNERIPDADEVRDLLVYIQRWLGCQE